MALLTCVYKMYLKYRFLNFNFTQWVIKQKSVG